MTDPNETIESAKRFLDQLKEAMDCKDYQGAFEYATDVEAELIKLKNWLWKQARD